MGVNEDRMGMRFRYKDVKIALSLALLLPLAGCASNDLSDLEKFVAEEKAKPAGHVKPLPQPQEYESYEYDATELRDPFVPIEQPEETRAVVDNGIHPDLTRNKEELERFPLDSLRMVGTLFKEETLWALVKDTDGTVHRVRTGNYMGQNYGKITEITSVKIELVEFVKDGLEGWVDRKATLALSQ